MTRVRVTKEQQIPAPMIVVCILAPPESKPLDRFARARKFLAVTSIPSCIDWKQFDARVVVPHSEPERPKPVVRGVLPTVSTALKIREKNRTVAHQAAFRISVRLVDEKPMIRGRGNPCTSTIGAKDCPHTACGKRTKMA
jgi:hypothetical protein